jgi:hypothetical protein
MRKYGRSSYVERMRIIMAKSMNVPPDNIDMCAIFRCSQRAIEEKVENSLDEYILAPANNREIRAVVSEIGEKIVPMIFDGEYPFENFATDYEKWYDDNLVVQFLKMKLKSLDMEDED